MCARENGLSGRIRHSSRAKYGRLGGRTAVWRWCCGGDDVTAVPASPSVSPIMTVPESTLPPLDCPPPLPDRCRTIDDGDSITFFCYYNNIHGRPFRTFHYLCFHPLNDYHRYNRRHSFHPRTARDLRSCVIVGKNVKKKKYF